MPSGTRVTTVKWRRIYLFDATGQPPGNDAAPVYIPDTGQYPREWRHEGVWYWRDADVPSSYRAKPALAPIVDTTCYTVSDAPPLVAVPP